MALVSLQTESQDYAMPEMNPYGYGTCLRLTEDQCKALGITTAPPAGTVYTISAQAVAKSVTQEMGDAPDDAPEICMGLQLTAMELTPAKGRSAAAVAKSLYPDME